jgi:hypothetical protein
MPSHAGPNTLGESNLVFAYDTGDVKNSYRGEPTTNVFTHYGTEGQGSSADNAVNFTTQGTTGFIRLGYGQSFGDYTIKPGDVVYKYGLGGYGCHYHGNSVSIPSGKYVTFTFDYFVSPGTTIETNLLANLENYGGSALGGGINAPNSLTGVWQTVTATFGPTGGSGTQAMFLYPGGCGTRFGNTGYILYKNPQVEFLPHKTPFVQTTRSATQGLLPLIGNSTIDLSNVSFDSNAQMTFDGTDDYIAAGNPTDYRMGVSNFTLECVMKQSKTSGHCLLESRGDSLAGYLWVHNYYSTGQSCLFLNYGGNQYLYFQDGGFVATTTTQYYHMAIVVNRAGNTISFYVNGNKAGNDVAIHSNSISPTGGDRYWVGADLGGSPWQGEIPIFKHYNRTLSAQELKQNYQQYKTRFNLS